MIDYIVSYHVTSYYIISNYIMIYNLKLHIAINIFIFKSFYQYLSIYRCSPGGLYQSCYHLALASKIFIIRFEATYDVEEGENEQKIVEDPMDSLTRKGPEITVNSLVDKKSFNAGKFTQAFA